MARQTTPPQKNTAQLTAAEMKAGIERIQKRIKDLEAFDPSSVTDQYATPDLDALEAAIDETLSRTFGAHTLDYDRYKQAKDFDRGPYNYAYKVQAHEFQANIAKSKANSLALLRQATRSLQERLDEVGDHAAALPAIKSISASLSRKIFIVHGHDEVGKQSVARFLEKLGLEAVILHERPNKGRTLITKFREESADVGFAVVLVTPDDHGAKDGLDTKPRARQNVVFELGFFIGALGSERVCALVTDNVEKPSDFDGVVYVSFADGRWQLDLARELKAAGYEIDLNNTV